MTIDQILEAFRHSPGDVSGAARRLGITPSLLLMEVRKHEHRPENGVQYMIPMIPAPRDVGRPSLRKHIISVRHRMTPGWPVQDRQVIEQARLGYDNGSVDMFQASDGPWLIQYARSRRKQDIHRRPWFSVEAI